MTLLDPKLLALLPKMSMPDRQALVRLHRYLGLALAGFLLLIGLTGSLLAWYDDLDAWLNPALLQVAGSHAHGQPQDPLVLRQSLLARFPQARIENVPLAVMPGRAMRFPLDNDGLDDEAFVDPYTGAFMGSRKWGELVQGWRNIMPFIYRLHYALALGSPGRLFLGVLALLWTLDCFVGAWLTLPVKTRKPVRGWAWLKRWRSAWQIRRPIAPGYKLNMDLHRAGGLWSWLMLLVLAWSAVAFNLPFVYEPVMHAILPHQFDGGMSGDSPMPSVMPPGATHRTAPAIDMAKARDIGRRLMAQAAMRHLFQIQQEAMLAYEADTRRYRYDVHSNLDVRQHKGDTSVYFNADSGALLGVWLPTSGASGDTFRTWITTLHKADVWGWPFRAFMSLLGVLVAMLSVTGMLIWLKKRKGRRFARTPGQ